MLSYLFSKKPFVAPEDLSNYRLISTLNIVTQIFENVVTTGLGFHFSPYDPSDPPTAKTVTTEPDTLTIHT